MLDTDTVSYLFRGQGSASARILEVSPSAICISALTLAELRSGADRVRSRRLHSMIDVFIRSVEVVPFDRAAADRFGEVAVSLIRRGTPIGTIDTLLAAQAIAHNLILVTNNEKHFARVPGLRTENWA